MLILLFLIKINEYYMAYTYCVIREYKEIKITAP